VSATRDASERLLEIERILAQSKTAFAPAGDADADPVQLHLASVPTERIRQFTAELRARPGIDHDDITVVTMRLLLNDYATAVAHLRAVARLAVSRVEGAAVTIRDSRKQLRREEKLLLKRGMPLDDGPPAPGASL